MTEFESGEIASTMMVTNENTTFQTFHSTTEHHTDDNDNGSEWFNIIMPLMVSCFFIILIFTFYKYIASVCSLKCRRSSRDRNPDTTCNGGTDNESYERSGQDLPPSYSILEQNICTIQIIEDEVGPFRPFEISLGGEKLPTYKEIMEENLRENNFEESRNERKNVELNGSNTTAAPSRIPTNLDHQNSIENRSDGEDDTGHSFEDDSDDPPPYSTALQT